MAIMSGLNKPLMSSRGPVGMIFDIALKGFGAGATANIIDKELLGGRMTATGVTLPFNLGTNPVRLNLTDLFYALIVNGAKIPTKKSLITFLAGLGLKKVAESRNWIDPPEFNYTNRAAPEPSPNPMPASPMMAMGMGGLTHS